MNTISNQKKNILQKLLIIFIILTFIIYTTFNYYSKKNEEYYLQQTTQTYVRAYNTIYSQYKDLADVIFSGFSRLGDIKHNLRDIDKLTLQEQAKKRENIYKKLLPRYNTLRAKHIKSVNIILPNNKIFLKIKNPSQFDVEISNRRIMIHDIHKNKKPIDTYEKGKNGAGFKFAYPIIENGKYLGIMSITFGANAITAAIMKQYYVLSNFFIDTENFNLDILQKKNSLFINSPHKGYIFDKQVLKELKNITRKDISSLIPKQNMLDLIYSNFSSKKALSICDQGTKTTLTIIPIIHSITKNKEAILTIRSQAHELATIKQTQNTIFILTIVLLIIVLIVVYQQIIKNILEKESLVASAKKDKQLLEQAKLAQMGEMIGNISHQWRQPLSVISTVASGIKMQHSFDTLKKEDIPKNMDIIVNNVEFLSTTIDTFRDFIKEGDITSRIFVEDKIKETINLIQSTLSKSFIKLIDETNYDKKTPVRIPTGTLTQVLINILNNAKDALNNQSDNEKWIKLNVNQIENKVIITIEDNAGGISSNIIEKIFDPYFTTKHKSQGTGLGLYMSYEIVTKHFHGKLYVKNTQNGAMFTVEIPLVEN